jgi:hypothetical protein
MNLALYEEPSIPFVSSYIRAYTTPGPAERAQSKKKKVGLLKNMLQIPWE